LPSSEIVRNFRHTLANDGRVMVPLPEASRSNDNLAKVAQLSYGVIEIFEKE
jgi:hypothetical protein